MRSRAGLPEKSATQLIFYHLKSRLVRISDPHCTLFFKYSRNLNTKLFWYSNGPKEVRCQMVWFFNAIWIPDKQTPSCFLRYWSGIQMVGLVQRRCIWIPNHWKSKLQILIFKCFRYSKGRDSDPTLFRWFWDSGIKILIVPYRSNLSLFTKICFLSP